MRLTAGAGAGVAGMLLAVVLDADQRRGEVVAEQGIDAGGAGFHARICGEAVPVAQLAVPIGAAISALRENPPSQSRRTCPQNTA